MPPDGRILSRSQDDGIIAEMSGLTGRERLVLSLVFDWPLASAGLLRRMSAIGQEVSYVLNALLSKGMVHRVVRDGVRRYVLSDMGLRCLSWRDRSELSSLRRRWGCSVAASPEGDNTDRYLKLSGGRGNRALRIAGGKLLTVSRQLEHLDGICEFFALMREAEAERQDFRIVEALPTHRSERWARDRSGISRGILPDASGVLGFGDEEVPFVLEYERRADAPTRFAERLKPYLRYYDAMFRYEDWGPLLADAGSVRERGGRF